MDHPRGRRRSRHRSVDVYGAGCCWRWAGGEGVVGGCRLRSLVLGEDGGGGVLCSGSARWGAACCRANPRQVRKWALAQGRGAAAATGEGEEGVRARCGCGCGRLNRGFQCRSPRLLPSLRLPGGARTQRSAGCFAGARATVLSGSRRCSHARSPAPSSRDLECRSARRFAGCSPLAESRVREPAVLRPRSRWLLLRARTPSLRQPTVRAARKTLVPTCILQCSERTTVCSVPARQHRRPGPARVLCSLPAKILGIDT